MPIYVVSIVSFLSKYFDIVTWMILEGYWSRFNNHCGLFEKDFTFMLDFIIYFYIK